MPNNGYFNAERDNELIATGAHFWCETCLVARSLDERSPDPRYCQGCYEFLKIETEALPATKRPAWRPKPSYKEHEKPIPVSEVMVLNMSTLVGGNSEVDIINPTNAVRPMLKRGPKHKALPVELITQWAGEGMGSKAIATRLKGEGVEVSYKTIQRILSGQRVLIFG